MALTSSNCAGALPREARTRGGRERDGPLGVGFDGGEQVKLKSSPIDLGVPREREGTPENAVAD